MYKFSNYISSVVAEMYLIQITSLSRLPLSDVNSTSELRLRIVSRLAVVWITTEKIAVQTSRENSSVSTLGASRLEWRLANFHARPSGDFQSPYSQTWGCPLLLGTTISQLGLQYYYIAIFTIFLLQHFHDFFFISRQRWGLTSSHLWQCQRWELVSPHLWR